MGVREINPYDHFADVFNGALESSGLVMVLSNYIHSQETGKLVLLNWVLLDFTEDKLESEAEFSSSKWFKQKLCDIQNRMYRIWDLLHNCYVTQMLFFCLTGNPVSLHFISVLKSFSLVTKEQLNMNRSNLSPMLSSTTCQQREPKSR